MGLAKSTIARTEYGGVLPTEGTVHGVRGRAALFEAEIDSRVGAPDPKLDGASGVIRSLDEAGRVRSPEPRRRRRRWGR